MVNRDSGTNERRSKRCSLGAEGGCPEVPWPAGRSLVASGLEEQLRVRKAEKVGGELLPEAKCICLDPPHPQLPGVPRWHTRAPGVSGAFPGGLSVPEGGPGVAHL